MFTNPLSTLHLLGLYCVGYLSAPLRLDLLDDMKLHLRRMSFLCAALLWITLGPTARSLPALTTIQQAPAPPHPRTHYPHVSVSVQTVFGGLRNPRGNVACWSPSAKLHQYTDCTDAQINTTPASDKQTSALASIHRRRRAMPLYP
ncbi:unnamed protein product [Periconia digitata]|uniref:Uncharacterized protein n=1 Tax=Periconia digitata TaxID=1303443 RepID=A0A9W4XME4_9PLEO|nr:unnamed protein product [Periconia digitata]